ncbi:hypothetical protein QBC43DRAFT_367050 [Cladorrhinum sp. PSN259]|nr:hypothetical protein QBC43DRAFT_367050 [Cladorrhinum sp. PSN259]
MAGKSSTVKNDEIGVVEHEEQQKQQRMNAKAAKAANERLMTRLKRLTAEASTAAAIDATADDDDDDAKKAVVNGTLGLVEAQKKPPPLERLQRQRRLTAPGISSGRRQSEAARLNAEAVRNVGIAGGGNGAGGLRRRRLSFGDHAALRTSLAATKTSSAAAVAKAAVTRNMSKQKARKETAASTPVGTTATGSSATVPAASSTKTRLSNAKQKSQANAKAKAKPPKQKTKSTTPEQTPAPPSPSISSSVSTSGSASSSEDDSSPRNQPPSLELFNAALTEARTPPRLGRITFQASFLDSASFYVALYKLYHQCVLDYDEVVDVVERWGENLSLWARWQAERLKSSGEGGGWKVSMEEGGMIIDEYDEMRLHERGKGKDKEDEFQRLELFDDDEEGEWDGYSSQVLIKQWRGTEAGCRLQNLKWEGKLTDKDVVGFVGRWWTQVVFERRLKEREPWRKKIVDDGIYSGEDASEAK